MQRQKPVGEADSVHGLIWVEEDWKPGRESRTCGQNTHWHLHVSIEYTLVNWARQDDPYVGKKHPRSLESAIMTGWPLEITVGRDRKWSAAWRNINPTQRYLRVHDFKLI